MSLLPWGEWRPDTADYESNTQAHAINNVIPRGDGYGPFSDFTSLTASLPAACRGAFYGLKTDGTVQVFAGTSTKLYMLNNSTFGWTDVSRSGGTYSAVASTAQWQFAQFGTKIYATQGNDNLQVFTLGVSSAFADQTGSPPQAAYVTVVGQFLVLSGLTTGSGGGGAANPYMIWWSGLGDPTEWTAGVNSSDFQAFPDGGIVRGIAGGEFGTIFQDQAIRTMSFIPGSSLIFQIERVTQDMGLYAPYSIVRSGSSIFFYSTIGFYRIDPGQLPVQVGRERVDRTFFADVDTSNLQLFIGASDPRATRVYWAYKSGAGSVGLFDKIIGYDKILDKWFTIQMSGEYLLGISQAGITIEGLDALAPGQLSITAMANNGSGNTRLTLAAESSGTPPYAGYTVTGQGSIEIYNATGTTGANANFKFQSGTGNPSAGFFTIVDSTHIDLGVAFVGTGTGNIGGSADAMLTSWDAIPNAVEPAIAAFNSAHAQGFFTGPNLQATLETAEQGTDGERLMVNAWRPVTDANSFFGSVSGRNTQGDTPVYTSEIVRNSRTGKVDCRLSTRYTRMKLRIPYGTSWTYAIGVEPDVQQDGTD